MDTTVDSHAVDTTVDSCGVDTTVDSCGVDTTVDSGGVDTTVDSCGCTQVWSGHSKDRCEVDTTWSGRYYPAVHACSVTFLNTFL